MFDHVLLRVSDRSATEQFYETVLEPLGVESFEPLEGITRYENLGITEADADHPVTTGLHAGLAAPSREHVDAFWNAGREAGYRDAGAPGPRPEYGDSYYGGFLLDPDGNSIEAVHDADRPAAGLIDHLWLRVTDLAAATGFYNTITPHTAFRPATESRERVGYRSASGSFSLLPGDPTRHLHLAFAAPDEATVQRFYTAATQAEYRGHGEPGERPAYGSGYYGAFVFDPDGNNVEAVHLSE